MADLRFLPAVRIAVALEAMYARTSAARTGVTPAEDRLQRNAFLDGLRAGRMQASLVSMRLVLDMPRRLQPAWEARSEIARAHVAVARFIRFLGHDIRRAERARRVETAYSAEAGAA